MHYEQNAHILFKYIYEWEYVELSSYRRTIYEVMLASHIDTQPWYDYTGVVAKNK